MVRASQNQSLFVDEHVGREAAYVPGPLDVAVDAGVPVGPGHRLALAKRGHGLELFVDADRQQGETVRRQLADQLAQLRQHVDAGAAPRRPEVDQHHAAPVGRQAVLCAVEPAARYVQRRAAHGRVPDGPDQVRLGFREGARIRSAEGAGRSDRGRIGGGGPRAAERLILDAGAQAGRRIEGALPPPVALLLPEHRSVGGPHQPGRHVVPRRRPQRRTRGAGRHFLEEPVDAPRRGLAVRSVESPAVHPHQDRRPALVVRRLRDERLRSPVHVLVGVRLGDGLHDEELRGFPRPVVRAGVDDRGRRRDGGADVRALGERILEAAVALVGGQAGHGDPAGALAPGALLVEVVLHHRPIGSGVGRPGGCPGNLGWSGRPGLRHVVRGGGQQQAQAHGRHRYDDQHRRESPAVRSHVALLLHDVPLRIVGPPAHRSLSVGSSDSSAPKRLAGSAFRPIPPAP